MNILVLDTSRLYYRMMTQLLEDKQDIHLTHRSNTVEAIEQVSTNKYSLICTALHLGNTTGIDFADEVQRKLKSICTPIILLTPEHSSEFEQPYAKSNISASFNNNELDSLVNFILRLQVKQSKFYGRVLYVEDLKSQRLLISAIFESRGLEVDAFETAEGALESFHRQNYDIVVTDLFLTGQLSGLDLIRRIRGSSTDKGNVPILALTGYDDISRRKQLFNIGVSDYVPKPVNEEELVARVKNLVSSKQSMYELERKRKHIKGLNDKLQNNQQQLEAIIDHLPEIFYTKSAQGTIIRVNKQFKKSLNLGSEQIINQLIEDILPPACAELSDDADKKVLKDKKPITYEENLPHRDGSDHQYLTTKVPLFDDEEKCNIILCLSHDITRSKRLQAELLLAKNRAEKGNQARSEFLSNISYEILNPMNAVIGMLQLAQETNLDVRQQNYLYKAKSSAQKLLHMLNDLIEYSKIESGKLEFVTVKFNLIEVLHQISDSVEREALQKNIDIRIKLENPIPRTVFGDQYRITQILYQLISNAIKFSHTDSAVYLSSKLLQESKDTVLLQFTVQDNGIGISKSKMETLFSRFENTDTTNTKQRGGIGLGLAIAYELTQLLEGRIWAESEEGKGSSFHLAVPLRKNRESEHGD